MEDTPLNARRANASPTISAAVWGVGIVLGGLLLVLGCCGGSLLWVNADPQILYPESEQAPTLSRAEELVETAWEYRTGLTPDTDIAWLEARAPRASSAGVLCTMRFGWETFEPDIKRGWVYTTFGCIGKPGSEWIRAFEIRTLVDGSVEGWTAGEAASPDTFDWTRSMAGHLSSRQLLDWSDGSAP